MRFLFNIKFKEKKEMFMYYGRLWFVVFVGLFLDFFDDGGGVDWDEIVEYIWIIVIIFDCLYYGCKFLIIFL